MQRQELVSIIVCSYNHEKYIEQCLDSVKAQTYKNIEVIIADDASQDDSVETILSWLAGNNFSAKKNFHQRNTGLATMLNECVDLIQGKYVKMIAADDFLHPEAIEKCVHKLQECGDAYGMVFTDTYFINEQSEICGDQTAYNLLGNVDKEEFRKALIKSNRIAALTVLMRTSVLRETGRYRPDFLVEDYSRWLKISETYYIAYIAEKLAYYRTHSHNISSLAKDRIEKEVLLLQMLFDKDGSVRQSINSRMQTLFLSGEKFSEEYREAYKNYPYHLKRLTFTLTYRVPKKLYQIFNKIL